MLNGTGVIHCGGSIISPSHILTAAHCLYAPSNSGKILPREKLEIFAGMINMMKIELATKRKVKKMHIHPKYKINSPENDVAIVLLDENLHIERGEIEVLKMAREPPKDKSKCIISGWGSQGVQDKSDILLESEVEIVPSVKCKKDYQNESIVLPGGIICAANYEFKADACQGDSGGPLACDGLLSGIVSTGIGCGDVSFPGIYSDVAHFHPWIWNVTLAENLWMDNFYESSAYSPLSQYTRITIILSPFLALLSVFICLNNQC